MVATIAKRAGLVLASLLVATKVADFVIGWVDPAGISHFANHKKFLETCIERRPLPPGGFSMDFPIPNSRAEVNVVYQINSLGFRGRETTEAKPDDVYRIVVLGDSVTFGWGVNVEDRYVDVVEKRLANETVQGKRIEFVNFAVPGYETMHHAYWFRQTTARYQPDAVVLALNRNDVQNDTAESLDLQLLSRKRLDEAGWHAKLFVDQPGRAFFESLFPNIRHVGLHRYIYSLRENDDVYLTDLYSGMSEGIEISLKLLAEMNAKSGANGWKFAVVDLHDVKPIEQGCKERGIPYQSISYPNDISDLSLRNSAVDAHPNAKGHLLQADRFELALRNLGILEAKRG
jgi:GDSL-like Lipase/Acylhydrolase family